MKAQQSIFLSVILMMASVIFMVSCKKDDDVSPQDEITEEDAVEVVENAVSEESGGLTEQVETSIAITGYADPEINPMCGLSFDSTIMLSNPSGTAILYSYTYNWNWDIQCNNMQIPQSFDFFYEMTGWYDAPRMKSEDSGNNDFTVAGLDPESDVFYFSGQYSRTGSNEMKTGFQTSFNSELTIEINEILISKTTGEILEGSGTVNFRGETSGGKQATFEGTITFTGGDTATLKFENEYSVSL